MREITLEWLREHDACEEEVELFIATFGDSAELTRDNARRAATAGLDIDWLADTLLDYAALRAYEEAIAPALRAYEEATAPTWRAYQEAVATAWRAYDEAVAAALCDALLLPRSED